MFDQNRAKVLHVMKNVMRRSMKLISNFAVAFIIMVIHYYQLSLLCKQSQAQHREKYVQ